MLKAIIMWLHKTVHIENRTELQRKIAVIHLGRNQSRVSMTHRKRQRLDGNNTTGSGKDKARTGKYLELCTQQLKGNIGEIERATEQLKASSVSKIQRVFHQVCK